MSYPHCPNLRLLEPTTNRTVKDEAHLDFQFLFGVPLEQRGKALSRSEAGRKPVEGGKARFRFVRVEGDICQ